MSRGSITVHLGLERNKYPVNPAWIHSGRLFAELAEVGTFSRIAPGNAGK
jgi:hypothetical protein